MYAYKDMTGQKIGRLRVIEIAEHNGHGKTLTWKCLCDCGKEVYVTGTLLRRKDGTRSCGCLQKDTISEIGKRIASHKTKHGACNTRLYSIWSNMKSRCTNPKNTSYIRYGGRGIRYEPIWERFEPFYKWAMANGYADNLTLERINVDGNYGPDNCKWATRKQQSNNRRDNHFLTYNGETHTIAEWSDITGIKHPTICARLRKGMSVKEILTTPVKKRSPSKARSNARASK